MRTAALTGLLVVFGYAATAQLSLLPQVGFENSKTNITLNDLSSFSPIGVKFSPQASLRLDYKFKQGHGPWLGISSSRSKVAFSFADAENAMNIYSANVGDMQVRIEGGYQHSFKPIYFKGNSSDQRSKETQAKRSSPKASIETRINKHVETRTVKTGCGDKQVVVIKNTCGEKRELTKNHCGENKMKQVISKKEKGPWMRIQPSLGIGVIPSVKTDVITKTSGGQTSYEYRAGNWNTALLTGAGFEFGRNNTRLFTVSLNYFKGLGNLNTQTISTVSGTKTTHTTFQSEASGWNMKVGIPFTLAKKPVAKPRTEQKKKECGQYRTQYKCNQRIRI